VYLDTEDGEGGEEEGVLVLDASASREVAREGLHAQVGAGGLADNGIGEHLVGAGPHTEGDGPIGPPADQVLSVPELASASGASDGWLVAAVAVWPPQPPRRRSQFF